MDELLLGIDIGTQSSKATAALCHDLTQAQLGG
jgi:hypothetical protein